MRKKVFLTGMFSLLLAFVMLVSACKSDDDDSSSSNNGGGGNSLLGTWVNDLDVDNNLNRAMIFTDSVITGTTAKVAYSVSLASTGDHNVTGMDTVIPIGASAPQGAGNYVVANLAADQFTLKAYASPVAPAVTAGDVVFKRGTGTTGSGLRGIWVSDVTNTDSAFTILVIGGLSGKKVWSAHAGSAEVANYQISVDAGTNDPVISWNTGTSIPYTYNIISSTPTLSIPPPGGGGGIALRLFNNSPTF
ncbi:MAG: hypothetical protein LBL76_06955 [Treponema sp.]|jgi:hypothetical protein|nr:hypothetical protein [Treponema sp.]